MKHPAWPRLIVAALVLVACASRPGFSKDFEALELGQKPPDFTLKDVTDRLFTLSDAEGEIVVLQFGSSTTRPYLEQIKPMIKLINSYRGKPVSFVTVYTKEQQFDWQAPDYVAKIQRADGLRFQFGAQSGQRMNTRIVVDEMEETVFKAYGAVPTGVFIVDGEGKLAFKAKLATANDIERSLKAVLSK